MSPPEPHDFGAELESGQIGRFRVRRRGSAKFDFLDPFYLGLTLSWPIFLAVVLGGLAAINIAFAGLYGCSPGAVQNLRRGDWLHALFFSAETFSTVGYGALFPASVDGHTVATVEMITGLFFDALLTGLIFVRFSRPRSLIVIADHAVINSSDGVTTLQIRLANGRDALLTGVSARLGAVKGEPHAAPGAAWDVQELKLQSGQMSVLPLTWTLVHRIEEGSPLHGLGAHELADAGWQIYVVVRAHDEALGASVGTLRRFSAASIDFDQRYDEAVSRDRRGRLTIDLTRLGATSSI